MRVRSFCGSLAGGFLVVVVLAMVLVALPAGAVTYMSVEPIPNLDVVGQEVLSNLVGLEFEVRERWADLLVECGLVQGVIDALTSDGTITTINSTNTFFGATAGGFEGQTNPSYLFTIVDTGVNAASGADIETLVNALGYVLNQGSTVHFSPDNGAAYDFPIDYITSTFTTGPPSGATAQAFFEHVGTVDAALFSGDFAGYTRIGAALLFLQPAVDGQAFIDGMYQASMSFADVEYGPLDDAGDPTTAPAGVAFRDNDWLVNRQGEGYLSNVDQNPDANLGRLPNLGELRRSHLRAVKILNRQTANGRFADNGVRTLDRIFTCSR